MADSDSFDFNLENHIAGDVGEKVRTIISAAEATAAVIKREAEQEAEARRRLAEAERARYLESARSEVDELVRQRVARMGELSESLIQGAERLLSQLGDAQQVRRQFELAVSSLAQAAEQLTVETRAGWASRPAATSAPAAEPPVEAQAAPSFAAPAAGPAEAVTPEPDPVAVEPEPEPAADEPVVAEIVPEPAADEPSTAAEPVEPAADEATEPHLREVVANGDATPDRESDDDTLAARLVALQMAVAGSPRGEVEEHLRVTFDLDDTTTILNDVFGAEAPPFAR